MRMYAKRSKVKKCNYENQNKYCGYDGLEMCKHPKKINTYKCDQSL